MNASNRCPHAVPPVLQCWRCVQLGVEPPENMAAQTVHRAPRRHKRARGWCATLRDGRSFTYPVASKRDALAALLRTIGTLRQPRGTQWQAL